jgi:uncharacterized oxidoreductase
LALDPDWFTSREDLVSQATQLAETIRATPHTPQVEAILLPGDPERNAYRNRDLRGIPLDDNHWAQLTELASELGVEVPR